MLAIDLGGTRVKAGMVGDGAVSDLVVQTHGGASLDDALDCVAQMVRRLAPEGCPAVGMCVPGIVDDGRVVALPGKLDGAVGADLLGWLRDRSGGRAVVVNDAVAYGVGEAHDMTGRTVVMTIGTGVGVAVLEGGQPLGRGPWGAGQLSGQLPLTADGPLDTSGAAGTVEAWCRAAQLALHGPAAYRGWLARGIAALCLAHAPDTVVVGGGPIRPDGRLLEGVQELVDPLLWAGQRVEVRAARYGDAAGLIGLAVLAGEW